MKMRPRSAWLYISAAISLALLPASLMAAQCTSGLYNSLELKETITQFSPYEKVFIKTKCVGLAAGEHIVHVNWIHEKIGLFRSDKHDFKMDIAGERVVYFWFRLMKKGPFSSALTNRDFHEENFGHWSVEVYLNDELTGKQEFEILPGTG